MNRGIEAESARGISPFEILPVEFYCPENICALKIVKSRGWTIVEALNNINLKEIPNCKHGLMHSARSTVED